MSGQGRGEDGDPADTATFDTTTDDKGLHYHVGGLGMGPDGLTYTRVEQFDLNMGAGDDLVTVTAIDPVTRLTLNLGNGDDVVDLRAMEGDLTINGGAGDDTVNAGSLAPAVTGGDLAAIAGELAFAGGTGTDVLNLDDTAATVDQSAVITGSTLAGLGMGDGDVWALDGERRQAHQADDRAGRIFRDAGVRQCNIGGRGVLSLVARRRRIERIELERLAFRYLLRRQLQRKRFAVRRRPPAAVRSRRQRPARVGRLVIRRPTWRRSTWCRAAPT